MKTRTLVNACNMTRFDKIFWLALKLNGAFWRFKARRLLRDPIVLPTDPHPPCIFFTHLDVWFFSLFEMKCRPGSTGPIGTTPVMATYGPCIWVATGIHVGSAWATHIGKLWYIEWYIKQDVTLPCSSTVFPYFSNDLHGMYRRLLSNVIDLSSKHI